MAALTSLLLAVACEGTLGEQAAREPGRGQDPAGDGRTTGDGGRFAAMPDPGAPRAPLTETEVGAIAEAPNLAEDCRAQAPPSIHRLTPTEYRNSMRALFPTFSGELAFPVDRGLVGFDNQSEVLHPNPLLVEAIADNAAALAAHAVKDLDTLVACQPGGAREEEQCARRFIEGFGLRALRQPLTSSVVDSYMGLFIEHRDSIDFEAGIELTLAAMLQAPELVYRISPRVVDASAQPDGALGYAVANRLSYAMLQGPPDDELLAAAAAGRLDTPEGIRQELALLGVRGTGQVGTSMIDFHRQWLELDRILDPVWNEKDPAMFPDWSPEMITSVHAESLAFIEEVMVRRDGGLAELLTSRAAVLDANTAALYAVGDASDGPVELPEAREGIFSRAAFLASHAHERNGSPPLRGISIMERAFCMQAGQPPPDADTSNPADEADAADFTNRELFERRAANSPCNSCHRVINAFAYPLEAFDAVGAFRTQDNNKPVDTTTQLVSTDIDGPYADWTATAQAMAGSDMVRSCASDHWFEYSFGRKPSPEEGCVVDDLTDGMAAGDSFRTIMQRAAMYAAAAETE